LTKVICSDTQYLLVHWNKSLKDWKEPDPLTECQFPQVLEDSQAEDLQKTWQYIPVPRPSITELNPDLIEGMLSG